MEPTGLAIPVGKGFNKPLLGGVFNILYWYCKCELIQYNQYQTVLILSTVLVLVLVIAYRIYVHITYYVTKLI